MTAIINTKLGEHRGKKRFWIEGNKLLREGVSPGARYNLTARNGKLLIQLCDEGKYLVSKRMRSGVTLPIIDLATPEIAELFEGVTKLRVSIRNGTIVVSAHQQIERIAERVDKLKKKLANGESLSVCSLFHGGGVLDKAMHRGFSKRGIRTHVEVAVEIESRYLESSLINNPELWSDDSIIIESPIEDVNIRGCNSTVDIVIGGAPCTGASKAGRSKNKLEFAESHDTAGAIFFYFLEFVLTLNPAIVIFENVVEYQNTASMVVIRSVLLSLGYELQERILDGNVFGVLEKRKRLCLVAMSQGIDGIFSLSDDVVPLREKEPSIKTILEKVPEDSARWKNYDYLAAKEERDIVAGKGFRRQLLTGDEPHCFVLGRHYFKCRSTEPFLLHPKRKELSRLFTPIEHARLKGIPREVISGLSETIAHEVLGQSICFPAWEAVAVGIGHALQQWSALDVAEAA